MNEKVNKKKGIGLELLMVVVLLFRYLPALTEKLEWLSEIRALYLEYVYNGVLGGVLKPVCEALWNWEFYPSLYKVTGVPLLVLLIVHVMWRHFKGKTVVKTEKKNSRHLLRGGTYRELRYPLFMRFFWCLEGFYYDQRKSSGKGEKNLAVCRVTYDNKEEAVDLSRDREWFLGTVDEKLSRYVLYYDEEKDTVSLVDKDKDCVLCTLDREMYRILESKKLYVSFV